MRACASWRGALGLLAAAALTPPLAAQGVVSGVVLNATTLAPVADARVSVSGADGAVATDAGGRFRLTGVAGTEVELEVRRIGYRPASQRVSVGAENVRILLQERVVELGAVVVTGTPGATAQRALGNAVATIDAGQVTETAQINSLQELLLGRVAGMNVLPATGMVGTGSRIRLRGASSFSLSNQPLIYVDGVRVNADPTSGPANQGFGSQSISRLNDFNLDEIESVEVIKGPAAATLYGTEASNGVIQIITKRGRAGESRWNLKVKQGANFLSNPEERFWTNYQVVASDTTTIDIVERESSLGQPIWRTGHLQEYDLSVTGGTDQLTYYAAGGYEVSEGADASNDVTRYSGRLNLTVRPNSALQVGANFGYVSGLTNLACEAGCGGRVWGTVLANPQNLVGANADRRGFHSGTPEQYDLLVNVSQAVDRFTSSVQVTHQPIGWFSQRLNAGVDRTREQNVDFTPRVDSLIGHPVWGSDPLGFKSVTDRFINFLTTDYAATASFRPSSDWQLSTSAGLQYYRTSTEFVFASGEVFPAPGLTAVSATTQNRQNSQDLVEEKTFGLFAQEQLTWRDRLYLTAGVRSDDHSAFGPNFDRAYYPKVSASWVVSEEPFWNAGFINQLRLRAAYGETGQQPRNFAALRTYTTAVGPSGQPAVTPQLIGNPDLGPERGREIELGFDAAVLDDRVGVEFTYYNKKTDDAILEREIAPSIGFSGFQFFNAGAVRNQGIELLLRGRPYNRANLAVDMTLSLATNSSEVLDLGVVAGQAVDFVTAATYLRHQVGYPIGAWFEQRVVSAQYDPATNTVSNVMCDNGAGGATLCAGADGTYGNADDAPDVYLGRTTPSLEGAFTTTVTLNQRIRLYALVDFKSGFRKLDGNTRVRCAFFGGRCRENFFPAEFAPERIAAIRSSNNLVDYLIDDAKFAKLREVSVAYTLPDTWAQALRASRASVQLAGRNLYTWTAFGGLEPEAYFLGGSRGGGFSLWEQTTLPQLTQWVLTVNLGF
ncbi:MAG: SusC/RagA family TonB-linked outer membrane protein [Gemmatimonadales bacterium]